MIDYAIQSIWTLGIAFFLYFFILRNTKAFRITRFYLLLSSALFLVLPLLSFTVFEFSNPVISSVHEVKNDLSQVPLLENDFVAETIVAKELGMPIYMIFYILISSLFLIRFTRNVSRLILYYLRDPLPLGGFKLILLEDKISVHSFFNLLFVNKEYYHTHGLDDVILNHERAHLDSKHSIDLIYVELLKCFFWFNPFVWLYQRTLVQTHEYEVDEKVLALDIDLEYYVQTLLTPSLVRVKNAFGTAFNYKHLKKRIMILQAKRPAKWNTSIRVSAILLLSFSFVFLYSFKTVETEKEFRVVIDAGHGGKDPGALFNGVSESSLTSYLANRIKEQSNYTHVEVILTRSNDVFMPLSDRSNLANSVDADLFLSLHFYSVTETSNNRVIYMPTEPSHIDILKYCALMSKNLVDIDNTVNIKTAPFRVLKEAQVPALLLSFPVETTQGKSTVNKEALNEISDEIMEGILEINDL